MAASARQPRVATGRRRSPSASSPRPQHAIMGHLGAEVSLSGLDQLYWKVPLVDPPLRASSKPLQCLGGAPADLPGAR